MNINACLVIFVAISASSTLSGAPGIEIKAEQFVRSRYGVGPTNRDFVKITTDAVRYDFSTNLSVVVRSTTNETLRFFHWCRKYMREPGGSAQTNPIHHVTYGSTNVIKLGTNDLRAVTWNSLGEGGVLYFADLVTMFPHVDRSLMPRPVHLGPDVALGSLVSSNHVLFRTERLVSLNPVHGTDTNRVEAATVVRQLLGISQVEVSGSLFDPPAGYTEVSEAPSFPIPGPELSREALGRNVIEDFKERVRRLNDGDSRVLAPVGLQNPGAIRLRVQEVPER